MMLLGDDRGDDDERHPRADQPAVADQHPRQRLAELERELHELQTELLSAEQQSIRWRSELIESEATLSRARRDHEREALDLLDRVRANERQVNNLDTLIDAMQRTVSWRVTEPLRMVRRRSSSRRERDDSPQSRDRVAAEVRAERAVRPTVPPAAEVAGFMRRLRVACTFLEHGCGAADTVIDAVGCFRAALDEADLQEGPSAWLALVVASGSYPDGAALEMARRVLRREGNLGLCQHIEQHFVEAVGELDELPDIEFLTNAVLVDLTHTAMYDLHTGIQRVARECASRWLQRTDAVLVHFNEDSRAIKRLSDDERRHVVDWRKSIDLIGNEIRRRRPAEQTGATLVPWRCVHVIPELVDSVVRSNRYAALQNSGMLDGQSLIGFDLIPVTAAEYTARGVAEAFSHYLSLIKHASAVSVISQATAGEFRALRGALAAQGLQGPRITATPLPAGRLEVAAVEIDSTRKRFHLTPLPLVLVVGSHEPRKNHLMVLEAAERLWSEGHRFELLFAGGASWGRRDFEQEVRRLIDLGHPLQVHRRVGERALWALYRLATYSVFISFLEGFGLPVAESLSCGTPAITSKYGSMAEIAAGGGALVVDPQDVHSVAGAMAELLVDRKRCAELAADAAARTWPSWAEYADRVWEDLVDSVRVNA